MSTTKTTVALFLVLSMAAVSCQKESASESVTTETTVMYGVCYSVDGTTHNTTVYSEKSWLELIDSLFALAEEGHRVSLRTSGNSEQANAAKEIVVFKTHDKKAAEKWAMTMAMSGYDVTIDFDSATGEYTCTAAR